jgi:hypothetical protein
MSAVNLPSCGRCAGSVSSTMMLAPTTTVSACSSSSRAARTWLPVSNQPSTMSTRARLRQDVGLQAQLGRVALVVHAGCLGDHGAGKMAGALAECHEADSQSRCCGPAKQEASGFDAGDARDVVVAVRLHKRPHAPAAQRAISEQAPHVGVAVDPVDGIANVRGQTTRSARAEATGLLPSGPIRSRRIESSVRRHGPTSVVRCTTIRLSPFSASLTTRCCDERWCQRRALTGNAAETVLRTTP